jgi:hypothetical protein
VIKKLQLKFEQLATTGMKEIPFLFHGSTWFGLSTRYSVLSANKEVKRGNVRTVCYDESNISYF